MRVAAIEAVGRQRRQFQEGGAGIDQEVDALTRQYLAVRGVALARGLSATSRNLSKLFVHLGDKAAHDLRHKK